MGRPLSAPSWASLIRALAARGVSHFVLTGGEPTLLPHFDRLTSALASQTTSEVFSISPAGTRTRQVPVSCSILTNGDTDLWKRSFCESLVGTRCRISVHVAGPPDIHETVTGGNHSRTLRTIQLVLAAGLALAVNLPLFRENLGGINEVVQDLVTMGVRHFNLMRLLPVKHAREISAAPHVPCAPGRPSVPRALSRPSVPSVPINPPVPPSNSSLVFAADFARVMHEVLITCRNSGATCSVGSFVPSCAFPRDCLAHDPTDTSRTFPSNSSTNPPVQLHVPPNPPLLPISHLCGCATRSFCIDPAGFVRPCTLSPIIGGTIADLDGALASPAFRAFLAWRRPPACAGCVSRDTCGGGCPAAWPGSSPVLYAISPADPWINPHLPGGSHV